MQRDFLCFAESCAERGHRIRVYVLDWAGPQPDFLEVVLVPVSSFSNHRRNQRYSDWVASHLKFHPVEGVIGFNKMPGLDVYYAADSCYRYKAEHERGSIYRLTPRYRFFAQAEEAVFSASATTHILLISRTEEEKFRRYYQTPESRLHRLPPGIDPERRVAGDRSEYQRRVQEEFDIAADAGVLLFLGSGFIKKGLDRAIRTVAELNSGAREVHLLIAGQDRAARFKRLARRLGVAGHCHFLGGRDDIPSLLAAADLLIHPARDEAAGIALLEAVVAGLPVVVTDVCGYADHIARADCGRVLSSPYKQLDLKLAVADLLQQPEQKRCRAAALDYSAREDLYSMHDTGAELIERLIRSKVENQGQSVGPHHG